MNANTHAKAISFVEESTTAAARSPKGDALALPMTLPAQILLDALETPVVCQNRELHVLWANRAACKAVELDLDHLLGRHCYKIWARRNQPC